MNPEFKIVIFLNAISDGAGDFAWCYKFIKLLLGMEISHEQIILMLPTNETDIFQHFTNLMFG